MGRIARARSPPPPLGQRGGLYGRLHQRSRHGAWRHPGFLLTTMSLPKTQRAWVVEGRGTPQDALAYKTDRPLPKLRGNEVLVKVQAAALNPVYVSIEILTVHCPTCLIRILKWI